MAKEVRNGFWVEVLRSVPQKTKSDPPGVERAIQPVHRLELQAGVAKDKIGVIISEDAMSWRSFGGICSSELSAVAISIAIGVDRMSIWLAYYLCAPLLLKFLAVCVSVHRDPIKADTVIPQHGTPPSSPQTEIFQIEERPGIGYSIIQGPDPVVRQFFRHLAPETKAKAGQIQRSCIDHHRLRLRVLLPCWPGQSFLDGPHHPVLLARIPDLHGYYDACRSITLLHGL